MATSDESTLLGLAQAAGEQAFYAVDAWSTMRDILNEIGRLRESRLILLCSRPPDFSPGGRAFEQELRISRHSDDLEDRFWPALQAFTTAAGNVSKVFWPVGRKFAARRARLRARLNVPDSSPIKSRKLRDSLEHFDERLEEWLDQGSCRIDRILWWEDTPEETARSGEIDPRAIFRGYCPKTDEATFQGQTFATVPIVEALKAVRAAVVRQVYASIPQG